MPNANEWNIGATGGLQFDPTAFLVVTPPDVDPPVISVDGGLLQTVFQNSVFVNPSATAVDANDGAVPVTITGVVNTAIIGTYNLLYEAEDAAGNNTQVTVLINVIQPPDDFFLQNIFLGPND